MSGEAGRIEWSEESILRIFVFAGWLFWAIFAVVTPVTTTDSQVYNLARLELALRGGLFHNPYWTSPRQIFFPWTFDAVHLPFVWIGFGAALPSFACFTGLLLIVFRLVKSHVGRREAWWACAAMLALPTLVFQATATKNDLAVVFSMACWLYAIECHRACPRKRYLWLMALALTFCAGSKSTGIPLAAIGAAATFWILRRSASDRRVFAAALLLGSLTMGSLEIYINNGMMSGRPLGPRAFVGPHRNQDGLRGASANLVRYLMGTFTLGFDHLRLGRGFLHGTEQACRSLLRALGLSNAGYGRDFNDANLSFDKTDWEDASDFGPLGGAALWFALVAAVRIRPRDWVWRLSVAALGSLGIVCLCVGWMKWNERFLILPVLLGTTALVIAVLRIGSRLARAALFLVIATSAIVFPFHSPNKNASGLVASLLDRDAYETREDPPMLEIVSDIKRRVASGQMNDLALCAGTNAWILSFFEIRGLSIDPEPRLASLSGRQITEIPRFLLLLDQKLPRDLPMDLSLVRSYAEPHSALYRVVGPRSLKAASWKEDSGGRSNGS